MKKLFICRTPFQCMTAIILSKKLYTNENVDLLIMGNFKDYKSIGEKIRKLNLFDRVYFDEKNNKKNRMKYALEVLVPGLFLKNHGLINMSTYDEIFTNSLYGDLENAIFTCNYNMKIYLYDEGYSTYTQNCLEAINDFSFLHTLTRKLSKVIYRRKYIEDYIVAMYLFDPELCIKEMRYSVYKIDVSMDLSYYYEKIFETSKCVGEYKRYKYIFFEESFANDEGVSGDLEIVNLIAKVVGKENILIKLHPRSKENRFAKLGYHTNENIAVPWEAISCMLDMDKITLISFTSGAVVNYRFLNGQVALPTILLYKLKIKDYVVINEEIMKWFDKYVNKYEKNIFVPKSVKELVEILES